MRSQLRLASVLWLLGSFIGCDGAALDVAPSAPAIHTGALVKPGDFPCQKCGPVGVDVEVLSGGLRLTFAESVRGKTPLTDLDLFGDLTYEVGFGAVRVTGEADLVLATTGACPNNDCGGGGGGTDGGNPKGHEISYKFSSGARVPLSVTATDEGVSLSFGGLDIDAMGDVVGIGVLTQDLNSGRSSYKFAVDTNGVSIETTAGGARLNTGAGVFLDPTGDTTLSAEAAHLYLNVQPAGGGELRVGNFQGGCSIRGNFQGGCSSSGCVAMTVDIPDRPLRTAIIGPGPAGVVTLPDGVDM